MSTKKAKGAKASKTTTKSASELLTKPSCKVACLSLAKAKKTGAKKVAVAKVTTASRLSSLVKTATRPLVTLRNFVLRLAGL